MKLVFQEYTARKIINIHRHVDGAWFWDKYSAHPYVGCRSGCEFCYLRGGRHLGRRDPDSFDTLIQVKTNAIELLRKELPHLAIDILSCGDWQQPAEDSYHLSRRMLEVVYELGFPLLVIERSPLLTCDLDLLQAINQRTWVGVAFSLSNLDPALKHTFEPRSPGVQRRLQAMAALAQAGILAGASLMPVIPFIGDDPKQLEDAVRAIKDHGGSFVLASGLSMEGVQAGRTLAAALCLDPSLETLWRTHYHWSAGGNPNYGPPRSYSARLGATVRELCLKHGLQDRMPRYILPGPLAVNKRIAEKLFLKMYDLELEQADERRVWAYRKAAWTVDEWPGNLGEVFASHGEAGLQQLPAIGKNIAREIALWLQEYYNRENKLMMDNFNLSIN